MAPLSDTVSAVDRLVRQTESPCHCGDFASLAFRCDDDVRSTSSSKDSLFLIALGCTDFAHPSHYPGIRASRAAHVEYAYGPSTPHALRLYGPPHPPMQIVAALMLIRRVPGRPTSPTRRGSRGLAVSDDESDSDTYGRRAKASRPSSPTAGVVDWREERALDKMRPRYLSNVLWGMAIVGVYDADFLRGAAATVKRRIRRGALYQFPPQTVGLIAWSYARYVEGDALCTGLGACVLLSSAWTRWGAPAVAGAVAPTAQPRSDRRSGIETREVRPGDACSDRWTHVERPRDIEEPRSCLSMLFRRLGHYDRDLMQALFDLASRTLSQSGFAPSTEVPPMGSSPANKLTSSQLFMDADAQPFNQKCLAMLAYACSSCDPSGPQSRHLLQEMCRAVAPHCNVLYTQTVANLLWALACCGVYPPEMSKLRQRAAEVSI